MIQSLDIHKSYQNLHVLKGVSVAVEKAEIVSIMGKSGAGKSTLLHILGTLDNMDKGTLFINNKNIGQMNKRELARFRNENIGFVFQFHHLLPEFTALENVCMPAFIANASEKTTRARANELLDYLGLSHRTHHKPTELSGGEQQRVAIARALMNNPAVVFADEPTGNLDSATSKDLHQLFLRLRNDFRQTFVIVTHSQELGALSDRCIFMQDGLILQTQSSQSS